MSEIHPALVAYEQDTRITQVALAELLSVTPKTIRKWKQGGTLPKPCRLGTIEFWTREQISEWLHQQELPSDYFNQTSA